MRARAHIHADEISSTRYSEDTAWFRGFPIVYPHSARKDRARRRGMEQSENRQTNERGRGIGSDNVRIERNRERAREKERKREREKGRE